MAGKRISKKSISNYLMYNWWKHAALAVLCVLGVDLLFATTAYRVPEDRKVEVYVLNGYVNEQAMREALWPALMEAYPEQEELLVQNINISSSDMYAYMQFSTYVAAQQGDVCLIPVSEVKKLITDGAEYAFLELTPFIESGIIDPGDIDLTKGRFRNSEGVEGLYAIPADSLYGLLSLGNDPAGAMLCILAYNGNDEPSASVLNQIIERYSAEMPEGYVPGTGASAQSALF